MGCPRCGQRYSSGKAVNAALEASATIDGRCRQHVAKCCGAGLKIEAARRGVYRARTRRGRCSRAWTLRGRCCACSPENCCVASPPRRSTRRAATPAVNTAYMLCNQRRSGHPAVVEILRSGASGACLHPGFAVLCPVQFIVATASACSCQCAAPSLPPRVHS